MSQKTMGFTVQVVISKDTPRVTAGRHGANRAQIQCWEGEERVAPNLAVIIEGEAQIRKLIRGLAQSICPPDTPLEDVLLEVLKEEHHPSDSSGKIWTVVVSEGQEKNEQTIPEEQADRILTNLGEKFIIAGKCVQVYSFDKSQKTIWVEVVREISVKPQG